MMLIKVLAAFCLGALMLAGLQTIGVRSLQQYLKSDRARTGMPVIGKTPDFAANFKASGIREALLPKGGPDRHPRGPAPRRRRRGAADRPDEPRRGERRAAAAENLRPAALADSRHSPQPGATISAAIIRESG